MMVILLILPWLFGNFIQKWYFPQGVSGFGNTITQIVDTDRDGHLEFIFTTYGDWPAYMYIYELHLPDTWQVDSVPLVGADLLWDSGDFDNDGLYDLALQFHIESPSLADGIMIYESPDSFSYPTQEVWRDTVGQPAVTPISVHDIDRDGLPEIVKVGANGIDFVIYESIGNNLYDRVYEDTIQGILTPMSTIGFGDFDQDYKIEFVLGNLSDGAGAAYWLYESPAHNTYEFIYLGSVPTKNIKDCFSVPDADGDGKLEFVVKGFVVPSARVNAFIFEATGDNTYEIIDSLDLFGGSNDYYGGYSDVGDVDGDSIPEIALEACQNIYIIKAAGNDSFYVWDYIYGNNGGSNVRVFDLDDNGLAEVIISGNNQTRIYEYEVGIAETTDVAVEKLKLDVHPNPFTSTTKIRCMIHDAGCKTGNYCMSIYDAIGRSVKSLYHESGIMDHGSVFVWLGDDEQGRAVAPGVYFVRLEAADYSATEKVLLIR